MAGDFVIGVDSGKDVHMFNKAVNCQLVMDCTDLSKFASGAYDFVFSSHLLEHFPYADVPKILREWLRVVKIGGNLVMYLPNDTLYPKCKEPEIGIMQAEDWSNADHKWNQNYERTTAALEKTGHNFDLVYYELCGGDDEYSDFYAVKKLK